MSVFAKFIILTFLYLLTPLAKAAKVPPVHNCAGAYNHLFKNPYEELHYKTKKKVSEPDFKAKELQKYEKEMVIEEFEAKLEFVSIAISRLHLIYNQGYDQIILQEIKDKAHILVNKFYFQGWEYISPQEIEELGGLHSSIYRMLERTNQTDLLD